MITISNLLLLFVGGGLGTICRFLITAGFSNSVSSFPFATFLANLISSFLIGLFAAYFMRHSNDVLRLMFITGYCGGFSTFSTFSMENLQLIQDGKWMTLLLYIALSVITCLFAVFCGMKVGTTGN